MRAWVVGHAQARQNEEGDWWASMWTTARLSFSTEEAAREFAENSAQEAINHYAATQEDLEMTPPAWNEETRASGMLAFGFRIKVRGDDDTGMSMTWTLTETLLDPTEEERRALTEEMMVARPTEGRAH